jgi:hypothetical protein
MIPTHIAQAAVDGDIDLIKSWLTSGERDVNEDIEGAAEAGKHFSLLHFALTGRIGRQDRTQLVELLLDHGADAHLWAHSVGDTNMSETALHLCQYPDEAALLLDRGLDIDAQTTVRALRPLHAAVFRFALLHLLVRRGANIFAKNVDGQDAEDIARGLNDWDAFPIEKKTDLLKSADFLAQVKRAGAYQKYLKEPRVELVRLRSLCDRGRAAPCSTVAFANRLYALTLADIEILGRLFGPSATKSPRGPSNRLPNEIFWNILAFWRTSRDELPP